MSEWNVWFTCCVVLNIICKAAYLRPSKRLSMVIYIRLSSSSRFIYFKLFANKLNLQHVTCTSNIKRHSTCLENEIFCICEKRIEEEQWPKFTQVVLVLNNLSFFKFINRGGVSCHRYTLLINRETLYLFCTFDIKNILLYTSPLRVVDCNLAC